MGDEKCPLHALYYYVYEQQQKYFLKLMKFCFRKGYMLTTTSHANSIPIHQFYEMPQNQTAARKNSNTTF